jgi:hypothetical protein
VWRFGTKTRQRSAPEFGSLGQLINFLKSASSSVRGGGAIYRIVGPEEAVSPEFDLNAVFSRALIRFAPLMRLLTPSRVEEIRLRDQETVDDAAHQIPDFDPASLQDGRKKVLQLIALRQGQAKFREKLFDAYGGCCAVTGLQLRRHFRPPT